METNKKAKEMSIGDMEALDTMIEQFSAKTKALRTAQAHFNNGDNVKGLEALKSVGYGDFFGMEDK